jgi:septum formation protein
MTHKLSSKKIILGSKSPRRCQLLTDAGFDIEVRTQDVEEDFDENLPVIEVAEMLALRKAAALLDTIQDNEILITADSVVILGQKIYNKPENYEDGFRILTELSGNTHTVATGVSITTKNDKISFTVKTEVTFEKITDSEINYYLTNYQPFDKAGAYGIQDWIGLCKVSKINGSYSNVMGLPMKEVYDAIINVM